MIKILSGCFPIFNRWPFSILVQHLQKEILFSCTIWKKSACNGELQNKYEYLDNGLWETFYIVNMPVQLCKYIEHGSLSCAQDGSENKLTHCAKTMLHNKAMGETQIFQWMIYSKWNMTLFVFVRHTCIIYICKFDISLILVFVRWTVWYHRPTFDWL